MHNIHLLTFIMITLYTPLSIIINTINLIQTFYIYYMYFVVNNYDESNIYTNDNGNEFSKEENVNYSQITKQKFGKLHLLILLLQHY